MLRPGYVVRVRLYRTYLRLNPCTAAVTFHVNTVHNK